MINKDFFNYKKVVIVRVKMGDNENKVDDFDNNENNIQNTIKMEII